MSYTSTQQFELQSTADQYHHPPGLTPYIAPPRIDLIDRPNPCPFPKRKSSLKQALRINSSSAFATFRSYAVIELQNLGYSRPSTKLLSNVWSSMSAKERQPWKVLAGRLNSDPVLGKPARSRGYDGDAEGEEGDSDASQKRKELDELALQLRDATIGEHPGAVMGLHARLRKLKL